MPDRKIIAVVGATGAQGSGLIRAILADPTSEFAVRAITRDPSSYAARRLAAAGADVVPADVEDEESLTTALRGTHGAFFVSFFWSHQSEETEAMHAWNMASAARRANVRHVIWSSFDDARHHPPSRRRVASTAIAHDGVAGKDAQHGAGNCFRLLGVPTTFLYPSFIWDNLIEFGMGPRPGFDGHLVFTLPIGESKLPGIAVDDIGRCALGIFKAGSTYIGQHVGIAGEHLSGAEMAIKLGSALDQAVEYLAISPELYRSFGFPGAVDLGNLCQFRRDFERDYCTRRNVKQSSILNPALQSFDQWLAHNANRITIEVVVF